MHNVLVTGCSSGFGLQITLSLARRGWHVFASMRNLEKRDALDSALAQAGVGDRVDVLRLNVTDSTSIDAAVQRVLAETGGALDAVVHNAGVSAGAAFEEMPPEEYRRLFETNVFGVFAVTQAVLPAMRERCRGRIVVMSSNALYAGTPALSIYCATKWALEGWAESVAHELRPFGIEVIMFEPGAYATEIWDSSPRVMPGNSPYSQMQEILQGFVDSKVVPRARDAREVGEAVADALGSRRPRFRNPMGPDAKANAVLSRILPYRVHAAVVRLVTGLWRVRA